MTEIEINTFILCAAFRKEPIFRTFKNLCAFHSDRKIDYVDFEWKYYQYYHGNRDLTIERPPSSSDSSSLTFSDLPMDALANVVGKLNLVDCLVVRKVSRNLRRLVDSSELHCGIFYLHIASTVEIDQSLFYEQTDDECCEVIVKTQKKKYKDNRNFEKVMLADVYTFLKNPKLKIDTFVLKAYVNDACLRFLQFLNSLNFKLAVRSIEIEIGGMMVVQALECLKPETLEEISIEYYSMPIAEFNAIAKTEQWRKARKCSCYRFEDGARLEKMLHFKEIHIRQLKYSDDNFVAVRDLLLKSAHLESGYIGIDDPHWHHYNDSDSSDASDDEGDAVEKDIIRIFSDDPAYDSENHRFSIANSRDYFQLGFERHYGPAISIKRIVGN